MRQFFAPLFVFLTALAPACAEARQKLWELDLSRFPDGKKDSYTEVWGISFSPDESQVAIGFGDYPSSGPAVEHIIVVSADSPSVVLHKFDLSLPNHLVSELAWAPSGTAIVIGELLAPPVILRLDQGPSCKLPDESRFGGFLSGDRMILTKHDSEVQLYRPDCSLIDSWKSGNDMRRPATSPEQDLLAVMIVSATSSQNEIIADTREVRARWTWNTAEWLAAGHGGYKFADRGRLFCSGNDFGKGAVRAGIACRDTQSGAIVSTNANVSLWQGSIHSSGGRFLAITDYDVKVRNGKLWHWLDAGGTFISPRRRLIWDARNSREIASWTGPSIKPSSVFALSPAGRYVAESNLLSVVVYALQP